MINIGNFIVIGTDSRWFVKYRFDVLADSGVLYDADGIASDINSFLLEEF